MTYETQQEIITREEAEAKNLRFFFTGEACKHGHVSPRRIFGATSYCVECRKRTTAKWRAENPDAHNGWGKKNPERANEIKRLYVKRHPERHRKAQLDYIHRNRESVRVYQRKLKRRLRETSEHFRFACNLRGRIRKAIVRGDGLKSGKMIDLIGCTVAELRAHLGRQFLPGMHWGNYGHGPDKWNVDHKIPCAAFDLSDPAQQRLCFHFTNLNPLWHPDNVRKGARLV